MITKPRKLPKITTWQDAFCKRIAPLLPLRGLKDLRTALATDDKQIINRLTVLPPSGVSRAIEGDSIPPGSACPLAYVLWKGKKLNSIGEVESAFSVVVIEADHGYMWAPNKDRPASLFLSWWDCTPRSEGVPALLHIVNKVLKSRGVR